MFGVEVVKHRHEQILDLDCQGGHIAPQVTVDFSRIYQ